MTRPEPGASATAAKLRAAGHEVIVSPLLDPVAFAWDVPEGPFDAIMFTSGAAARLAGPRAAQFNGLPAYCVGASTAAAATVAGFRHVVAGSGDAAALAQRVATDGFRDVLHLAGRDRVDVPGVTARTVYAAELAPLTSEAIDALTAGRVDWVLLFSARTAAQFAALWQDRSELSAAAISSAVLTAAGGGWRRIVAAIEPSEAGVLAAAGLSCDKRL